MEYIILFIKKLTRALVKRSNIVGRLILILISNLLDNKCLIVWPRPKTLLSNILEQRSHC